MTALDPDGTRIFWVRHGRIDDAWRGRIYGALDVPLAPEGEAEARRAAALLAGEPLAAVVSSGLIRAEFGAAALRSGRDLPRRDEPALRELERGAWRGKVISELVGAEAEAWGRWLVAPDRTRPEDGESLADLADRVHPAVDLLARQHRGAQLAIVSHGWVIRVAVCRALGLPLSAAPRLSIGTGEVVVIDHPVGEASPAGGRPTLSGFAVDVPPASGARWFRGPRR